MADEKNFFAGLFDFSFQQQLTRRIVKLLYILGILFGGIAVVAKVVLGYQQSSSVESRLWLRSCSVTNNPRRTVSLTWSWESCLSSSGFSSGESCLSSHS